MRGYFLFTTALKVSHNQRKQLNSSGYPSCGPRIFESCTRKVQKKSKNYASRRGPIEHLVVFWQTPQGVCKKRNFTLQGGPQVAECPRVVPLPARSGYISKNRGTVLEKSRRDKVYPAFFGHGRVKVGVDQSAVSVSRCKKIGTLLCRVLTSVCMYVCMVITYSRVWINRVRLPILLVVS